MEDHLHRFAGSNLIALCHDPPPASFCSNNSVSPCKGRQWTNSLENAGHPAELLLFRLELRFGRLRKPRMQLVQPLAV